MFEIIIAIVFFLIPWAIGWTVIADKVFGLFFAWLWSGPGWMKKNGMNGLK